MEEKNEAMHLLELMAGPAFCVRDGVITYANRMAKQLMLMPGAVLAPMLATGHEEYDAFEGGCLYLRLQINDLYFGASVNRMESGDVFLLEEEDDRSALNAMALAARELRDPLGNAMNAADRIMEQLKKDEDSARLNKGLYQILRIVSNMSDAARYTQPQAPCMQVHNLRSLMESYFSAAASHLAQAGITLTFTNVDSDIYSLANDEKLERAVFNLISNAAKFTPKGGRITAKLHRKGRKLYLTIADNGCGIADDLQASIFTRHLRQPGLEDGRYGIGIGMVLVRNAATSHGGTVLIQSSKDQGTRVTMTLEIRQDTPSNLRSPTLRVDHAGGWDHSLMELADCLPASLYQKE